MTSSGRIGRPPKVNREQVVAAAADILSTDGPMKFSMRSLAARLDISAMGIYHYFDSKNDLLGAVLEYQSWATPIPELPEDPRERLIALPLILVDHLVQHPWIIDVLAADEILDSYSAWSFNEFLETSSALGMSQDDAFDLLLSLWRLVVGEVVVRTNLAMRRERPNASAWYEREIPDHVTSKPQLLGVISSLDNERDSYSVRPAVETLVAGWLDRPERS